jgi:hypothetical protein
MAGSNGPSRWSSLRCSLAPFWVAGIGAHHRRRLRRLRLSAHGADIGHGGLSQHSRRYPDGDAGVRETRTYAVLEDVKLTTRLAV